MCGGVILAPAARAPHHAPRDAARAPRDADSASAAFNRSAQEGTGAVRFVSVS